MNPVGLTDADQYSVKISGYCNEKTSSADVTINENNQLVSGFTGGDYCVGDEVVLGVFANGVDLHFAWTRDETPVFADQNKVTISAADVGDSGHYKCVVTGKCGNPFEVEANVNVHPLTNITSTFGSMSKCEGTNLTLATVVEGDNLTYTWTQDGADLGVNSDTLVLTNALPDQSGLYTMKVSGICADDVASAHILVKKNTELVNALNSQEIRCEGEEVIYNVSALGHNLKYEWYYDGNLIPTETTNQLYLSKLVAGKSRGQMLPISGITMELYCPRIPISSVLKMLI
jgi:hypothetical protein